MATLRRGPRPPGTLALLPWVRQTCAPKRPPTVPTAAWRSLLAIGGPVGGGLLTGRPLEGVLVALGALSAVLTDVAAGYRHRAVTMLLPQLLGMAGAFTMLAAGGGPAAGWVLPALGVVAGVLSCLGPEGSLTAMILLMDAELVLDVPLPGPLWHAPALLLSGALAVVALALAGRPLRGDRPERALLAQCLTGCAEALEVTGPAGAARRRVLHEAVERARRTVAVGGSTLLGRHLPGLLLLSELASAAGSRGLPVDPALPARLRAEAAALTRGRTPGPDRPDRSDWPVAGCAFEARLVRAARAAVAPGVPRSRGTAAERLRRRAVRQWPVVRAVLADPRSWLAGLRVGLALLLAGAAAAYLHLPHPYWALLNVTFVCRPDVGPVTGRALERFAGTALAALVSGLVLASTGSAWVRVGVLAVAAGLIPALAGTGYLYQTSALATVVLMATELAGDPALPLLGPILANCAIGCLASVLACELFGGRTRQLVLARRLAGAVEQAALTLGPGRPRPASALAAPRAHLQLALARAEFDRIRREPPWRRRSIGQWADLIEEVERTVDTALATRPTADGTRHRLHRAAAGLHRMPAPRTRPSGRTTRPGNRR
ncbi:FUSC family protein [Kitasatospora sp. NPDC088134]|uniref:FUSC family protein n=1 Tax=Kitasatospora sp. NPDC088134 TaxID=3364071 RepID=UPI00382B16AC